MFYPSVQAPAATDGSKVLVVAVILVVILVTVGLAGLLYVMVSGLISGGPDGTTPVISWTGHRLLPGSDDDWEYRVAAIDRNVPFGDFQVSVMRGAAVVLGPTTLAPEAPLLGAPRGLHLNVTDTAGEGTLNGGDIFLLGNAVPGETYHVTLFWFASGTEVSRKTIIT
jgi:hypothetical protein